MRLPNLLIAGTQKGGTTTLHRMLSEHPKVFMSGNKEPGLFHNRKNASEDELLSYAKHFEKAPQDSVYIGESTAHYFWEKSDGSEYSRRDWRAYSNTPLIRKHLGSDIRVLLTLRHPVDRAISGYQHHATRGRIAEGETIIDAAKRPELGIVDLGFYTRHYEGWSKGLPEAKVFITTTDELKESARSVYESIINWLGLPSHTVRDEVLNTRWNSAEKMRKNLSSEDRAKVNVTSEQKQYLFDIYRDEILHWKSAIPGAKLWRENQ